MDMMSRNLTVSRASHRGAADYRADIDGLRAVAVTSVVLFHAAIPGVGGGFAGVDIFFVISGFLIGGIVHREIGEGRFTFAVFYARRARRILPALFAVSAIMLGLGLLILGPGELARFAISAVSALFGLSNLWFLHSTDYFTPSAVLEPFLMTWSLGIEEQFYLLLPPLLLLLRRFSAQRILCVIAALTAASLLLSVLATPVRPVESFYLLPTRAWELGVGVVLAMMKRTGFDLSGRAQEWLAPAGLAAIGVALVLFDERVRFPGYAALLPTLGTMALIATPDSRINRHILASRPFVAIGRLSYSWYLWHWPLLALLRISAAGQVSQPLLAAIAIGSIVPAWFCWRWIERPFRQARPGRRDKAVLGWYCIALVLGSAVFGMVALTGGLPGRAGPPAPMIEAMLSAGRSPCLTGYGVAHPDPSAFCNPRGDRPLVALLGDSHASALSEALRERAGAHGYDLLQMTAASCPPLRGATLRLLEHPGASQACAAFNAAAIDRAARDPRVKIVVLTAFWQSPFSAHALTIGDGVVEADGRFADRSSAAELRIALNRTLTHLRAGGKQVVLLGDVPWMRFDPARHVWASALPLRGAIERYINPGLHSPDGFVDDRFFDPLLDQGDAIVRQVAREVGGVRFARLRTLLCPAGRCRSARGNMPFFIDQQHLSRAGADYVVDRLDAELWLPASNPFPSR